MKTHKFARKPFYVDAVRVSEANIAEVAEWCEGTVEQDETQSYVKVKVHRPLTERQTQAFIGDWVLFAGTGFKVYTPKAFDKSFEKVKTLTKAQADAAGIKVPHEPRPPKVGVVGEALLAAQKKGPVPTPPKVRKIENAEIQSVSVVSDPINPEAKIISTESVQQAEINLDELMVPGQTVEVAPGIEVTFNEEEGNVHFDVNPDQISSATAAALAPRFSEIVVDRESPREFTEEEKDANARAAIEAVLNEK